MNSVNLSAMDILCSDLDLFDAEQRIADYILQHQAEAAGMTLASLAQASGASEATVSRFCKRLGFESYRTFQISLARDVHERPQPNLASNTVSIDELHESLQNILAVKVSEITGTIQNIDENELQSVLNVLGTADVVQVAATGNTIPVAMDAAFKFNQLGIRCTMSEIAEKSSAFALALTKRDALLVFSNSGRSKRLLSIARAAKSTGAKLILITGNRVSPLSEIADHVLLTVNREKLLATAEFPLSRLSALALVEVLFHLLLVSVPEARTYMNRHKEFMKDDKSSLE